MGKFNYTTNITGYRSTSVRRAIYRRSSPKDCCNRPQYRMLRPTPAPRPPTPRPPTPRPPTPRPPAPTPVLISCGDTFIGSNRRCNTPSVHGGNCADYYEFNENEGAYYNCEKDKYDVTLGQYRCRSGKKCSACKSECCKADCAIKWPGCAETCCLSWFGPEDECKRCTDKYKCKSNPVPTPTSQKIMVKQSYRQCFSNSGYKSISISLEDAKAMCKNDSSCNCIDQIWEPNMYTFYTSASLEIDENNGYNTWIYTVPPKWKKTTTTNYECKNHKNESIMLISASVNNAIEWCKNHTIYDNDASCKCLKKNKDGWETFSDYTLAKSGSTNSPVYIYTSDPIPDSISAPIIESSDNVSSKLKILCLHGGGQSVDSFRVLVTDLINELSEFEFVFAKTSEEDYVWIRDPPGGKDEPTTDPNWANNSINNLDELVSNKGPFYGILGYSQGAAMALVYLAYLQETNKDKELSFKKVILFNGYLPTTHQGLVSSINNLVIDAPILKIVGKKDYAFYELGKILYNQLDKNNTIKLIEDQQLGHSPPALEDSSFEEVVYFIKK